MNVDYQKLKEEVEPRIEWLKKEGKYIEAFFFMCAVLEQELAELTELYEKHSARLVANYGYKLDLQKYRAGKKMTLGQLKNYLAVFVGHGNLIKELDYFIDLRNNCVHKLLGNSISALDVEVSKNLNRYYRLLFWLVRRQVKLYKSEIRSHKRKTVTKGK